MDINHIFVVGAGTMGSGIAQTAAVAGFQVTMMDVDKQALQRGKDTITASAGKLLKKERINQQQHDAALAIKTVIDLDTLGEADLVIEAATENPELKTSIFKDLDQHARPEVILASNTSSISLDKLAAATNRPRLVVGMHFFNPVPLMALLEVVKGYHTTRKTVAAVVEVGEKMGKTPVVVKDSPGFVANRILCPMLNEAILVLEEELADKEGIDTIMKLGMGHPIGPLKLADMIGLDVLLAIMEVLHHDIGDDKYKPAPLLRRMVEDGQLGRKSGKGFYEYDKDS